MPEFSPKIDFGHVLTIGILLVSIGIAWGNLSGLKEGQATQAQQTKDGLASTNQSIKEVSDKVGEVKDLYLQLDGRMRSVERQVYRQPGYVIPEDPAIHKNKPGSGQQN